MNIMHKSTLIISPTKIYKATLLLSLIGLVCILLLFKANYILRIAYFSEMISQKIHSETHHVLSTTFCKTQVTLNQLNPNHIEVVQLHLIRMNKTFTHTPFQHYPKAMPVHSEHICIFMQS